MNKSTHRTYHLHQRDLILKSRERVLLVGYFGEQGWRNGESARLPPMWPGLKSSRRRHMWVEFVVVLSLAPRSFSPGIPVFPSPQKPTFSNSNSTRNQVDEEPLCGCATCKPFYLLFIYLTALVKLILTVDAPRCHVGS